MIEPVVTGMGYELVDLQASNGGRFLRLFIDKPVGSNAGINVDDCAAVSRQLSRVLEVEGVDYDRLEVSSPGLDRPLRQEKDFVKYAGHKARIKVRVPVAGQRNFVGVLRETRGGKVDLEVDGKTVSLELANLDRARLVPAF